VQASCSSPVMANYIIMY